MTEILTTDSFDAYTTEKGILIKEKKNTAKKFGAFIIVAGIVFIGISFLPLDNLTYEWIMNIFYASFFWGGASLFVAGLVLFIVKGLLAGDASSTFDNNQRELTLRGKVIPYAEIDSIFIQTQEVMNRKMSILIVAHKGKKRPLVSGTVFSKDEASLEGFINDLDALVKEPN